MAVGDHRVVGREDQSHVPQLPVQPVAAALRRLVQFLGPHAGALQLVHRLQQHALQFRSLPGRAVDLQVRPHSVQGQGHAQKPPALVQQRGGQAPVLLGHVPGQACEAQHLRRAGQSVSADAAELPFCLVAVLLGHQQHPPALPPLHGAAELPIDGRRFAGAGLADDQAQHPSASFRPPPEKAPGALSFSRGYCTKDGPPLQAGSGDWAPGGAGIGAGRRGA